MPSKDGIVPSKDDIVPSKDGIVPSKDGIVPSKDGILPSKVGVNPAKDGMRVASSGQSRKTESVDGMEPKDGMEKTASCRPKPGVGMRRSDRPAGRPWTEWAPPSLHTTTNDQ